MIQVTSAAKEAGDFAEIKMNDEPIPVLKNHNRHYRGLHIVIINPYN